MIKGGEDENRLLMISWKLSNLTQVFLSYHWYLLGLYPITENTLDFVFTGLLI